MENNRLIFKAGKLCVIVSVGMLFICAGYQISVTMSPAEAAINQYTPIMILLTLVLYESFLFVFFVIRRKCHKKNRRVADDKNKLKDTQSDPQNMTDQPIKELQKEDNADFALQETIVRELFARQYTMEQITAMIRVVPYIKNIQAELLIKMFRSDMSPEEIGQYIEMFYG